MLETLRGKAAIVTGAARGIGGSHRSGACEPGASDVRPAAGCVPQACEETAVAEEVGAARPLERSLALRDGLVRCPRRGRIAAAECDGCLYFCRREADTATVICSYPFLARDTLARRSRRRHDVRIALRHHLERS